MSVELALPALPGSTASSPARDATTLDDPVAQAAFTTWDFAPDGRRIARSHLRLGGLWCAACAGIVERTLLSDRGVVEASVNYGTRRAAIAWDPASTRLSDLLSALRRAGYDGSPDVAASARTLRQVEQRAALWRLFVAAFCMMQVMMFAAPAYFAGSEGIAPDLQRLLQWASWLLSIPVVLFAAAPMFREAWAALRARRIGMDLPVAVGIAVTFVASSGVAFDPGGVFGREAYFDSLTMFVTFLLGGRYLAVRLQSRVAETLEGALDRLPSSVRRIESDGRITRVGLDALRCGDRVQVPVGEAFPVDGPILDGTTAVDESLLTGESRPIAKGPGDEAIAGSLNLRAPVLQRVERLGADTRYAGIVVLMRDALSRRPPLLRSADRVAGPFLWGVLVLAALGAAVWSFIDPGRAVWVAVSVLIVTCPCALSLAAPSACLAAASALVRRGVLVQRVEALEALARIDTLCFDKTGTLTDARLEVAACRMQPSTADAAEPAEVLQRAGALAAASTHPVAMALAAHAQVDGAAPFAWRDIREAAGCGLEARAPDGTRFRLGAREWAAAGRPSELRLDGVQVWFAGPLGLIAGFALREALRPDAEASIDALRREGLALTMSSGDGAARVAAIAGRLGIADARGAATPAEKVAGVEALQRSGHRVGMVGDGVNDAPVMAVADVSFAIGGGAALTRAKADFVLMSGRLADIVWARRIAGRTMRVVRQNLGWAITYNAACVPLALVGWFPPWAAGLGMAASSLFVLLNAARIDRAGLSRSAESEGS